MLLQYSWAMQALYFWIPNNLNIDEHLENYDFSNIDGFNKDKLHYLLHLISDIPSCNKDKVTETGYISLNATLLQKWVANYKQYIDLLIKTGIVECDGEYHVGKKSRGYRFTEAYRTPLRKVLVTDLGLISKVKTWRLANDLCEQTNVATSTINQIAYSSYMHI